MKVKKYLFDNKFEYFDLDDVLPVQQFIRDAIKEKIAREAPLREKSMYKFLNNIPLFVDNIQLTIKEKNFISGTCEIKIFAWVDNDFAFKDEV